MKHLHRKKTEESAMQFRKEILKATEETPVPRHADRDAGKRRETMPLASLCGTRMRISASIDRTHFPLPFVLPETNGFSAGMAHASAERI